MRKLIFALALCLFPFVGSLVADDIYKEGWIDRNKNGVMDPYENPELPIEERIADLIGRMTVEEKTCQMGTIYGYKSCLLYTSPSPRDKRQSRMPSSA